jgi:hypothetical protein
MNNDLHARQKWQHQLAALWPALKGSLAKVYKPCIRKNCPACARGDKHPAWLLSFTSQGRRKTMYVPLALVPTIKKALQNGRKIEQLLYRSGPQMLKQHRQLVKTDRAPGAKS